METHNESTVRASIKKAESLSIVIFIETKGMMDLKISMTIFSWPVEMCIIEAVTPNTDAAIHMIFEIRLQILGCLMKTRDAKAAKINRNIDVPNKVPAVNIPMKKTIPPHYFSMNNGAFLLS